MVTEALFRDCPCENDSVEMPCGNINTDSRQGEPDSRAPRPLDYKIDLESIRGVQFWEQGKMCDRGIKSKRRMAVNITANREGPSDRVRMRCLLYLLDSVSLRGSFSGESSCGVTILFELNP